MTKKCSVCGRMGHEGSACYKVIGFPEWWGDRSRNRSENRGGQYTSTGRGRGVTPKANVAQINTATIGQSGEVTDADRQGLSGLSDEQWATVQKLINAGKVTTHQSGKSHDTIWIMDTGAIHHMTGRLDLLENIRDIDPISVVLPARADVLTLK